MRDGYLLASHSDDPCFDDFFGTVGALDRNLAGVADVVGLTTDERRVLTELRNEKVIWR